MKQTEENNIPVLPESAAAEARPQDARDTNTTAAATTESAANASETPSAATDAEAAPRRRRSRRKPAAASADAEAPEAAAPAASESRDADAKATATEGTADKAAPARPKADAASDGPQSRSTDAATDESATAERSDAPATPESAPAAEGTTRRKRSRNRRRKSAAEGTPEAGEQAAPAEATEAAASGTRKGAAAAANADGTSGSRKESAAEADDKTAERKEATPNRGRQERAPKGDRQGTQQKLGREGNARSDRSKQQQEPSRRNAAADKSASNDRKSGERKPQRERRRSQSATQQANGAADTGRRAELRPVKIKPGKKLRRGTVAAQRTWALVTGAGTGIGRCYALRLAASGYQLVLVGNRRNSLEAVRREILDAAAEGRREACEVRICQLDLAHAEAAEKLLAWTRAQKISVDLLINNAGIFSFRDILRTPIERIERIILLHNLTLTKLCRLYASDMVYREAQGHILNMSSFSLWMPFPGLSLYSASKAYVRSFSVSFAREVRESGIRVTAVCPAGVATDLYGLTPRWQRIGLRIGALISADACARRGLRALRRGRRCIVPDWWNRIWIPLCKSLPMTLLRPLRKLTMKYQK